MAQREKVFEKPLTKREMREIAIRKSARKQLKPNSSTSNLIVVLVCLTRRIAVHRHRHIVRIATEKMLGSPRIALGVLDREHLVGLRFGHRRRVPNMDDSLFQTGIDARTRVLGPEFVTKAFSTADSFNRDMQEMVTEYCWGGVWGRTALSDQQRSLNNLCILASLNRSHEFKLHFRGALRNGCSLDELRDTLDPGDGLRRGASGRRGIPLAREVLEPRASRHRPATGRCPTFPTRSR